MALDYFARRMTRWHGLTIVLATVAFFGATGWSAASDPRMSFSRIADQTTVVPARTASTHFVNFNAPVIDGSEVAFIGGTRTDNGDNGIYTWTGGTLHKVVDWTNDSGYAFVGPSLNDGHIAFAASLSPHGTRGVYTDAMTPGTLTGVVTQQQLMPGRTAPDSFGYFSVYGFRGQDVVFWANSANGSTPQGIFAYSNGSVAQIAGSGTIAPVGGTMQDISGGAYADGRATFVGTNDGSSPVTAVYSTSDLATIQPIVTQSTLIPGSTHTFQAFGSTAVSGDATYFYGIDGSTNSGGGGLYMEENGVISTVADSHTRLPNSPSDTFWNVATIAADNGVAAFTAATANDPSKVGIFTNFGGQLSEVIQVGDTLDGKTVSKVLMSSQALSGDYLTFAATFSDNSQAAYLVSLAAVPEPSILALLGVGTACFAAFGWRRRWAK